MLVRGKASNLDVGYSPNLGAILLLHIAHQANHVQGDIVCGGVIIMLANTLGLNYHHLCPIVGRRFSFDQEGSEQEDEEELALDEEDEEELALDEEDE